MSREPDLRLRSFEQTREWLPLAPLVRFARRYPDVLKDLEEKRARDVRSQTPESRWIEFDTIDKALRYSPYIIEDIYGFDYPERMVTSGVPPKWDPESTDDAMDATQRR